MIPKYKILDKAKLWRHTHTHKKVARRKEGQTGRAQMTLRAVKLSHQLCNGGSVTLCI